MRDLKRFNKWGVMANSAVMEYGRRSREEVATL